MIPVLLILLAAAAAVVSAGTWAFVPAVVNGVLAFWSNGVAANFTRADAYEMPDWAAQLSAVTALLSVLFLVLGLVLG